MKFLINRTDAIGDNILTMPMARALKEHYPECQVAVITSKRVGEIYENHPYIDKYFILNKNDSFFKKFYRSMMIFKIFRPSHYFFVGGSHVPSLVAFLKRIGFRGGLKSKWQTFLFLKDGVRQKRSIVAMHESEYNLELLRPLIDNIHSKELYRPHIEVTTEEVEKAWHLFQDDCTNKGIRINSNLIVIHPGMTGHTLNWSSRNYGRLITRLIQRSSGKFTFVISHTPSDERFLKGLREELMLFDDICKDSVYFFDGSVHGLRNYMAFLTKCHLFIGPSTGTTHIANVLGLKTIALYSPIKVQSAARWKPFNSDKLKVLVPDVVCGEQFECAKEACPYYECMAKIEVDDVINVIKNMLEF